MDCSFILGRGGGGGSRFIRGYTNVPLLKTDHYTRNIFSVHGCEYIYNIITT